MEATIRLPNLLLSCQKTIQETNFSIRYYMSMYV